MMPSLNSLSSRTVLPLKLLILVLASSKYPTLAAVHRFIIAVVLFLAALFEAHPRAPAPVNKHHTWLRWNQPFKTHNQAR